LIFLEALTIAIGPTGSGKSLFEMVLIDYFLRVDTRPIITTLAIIPENIAEFMQQEYGDRAPSNIASRIIRIYADDLATFWRCRGIEYDGQYGYLTKKLGRFGGPDWQVALPGVIYLLDELQVKFKAREFMKNSGEFLDYQPQARKLGDTIIGVSPASSLLDKAFRDLANKCVVLQNMYKVRVKGFTAPRKIVGLVYQNCPPVKGEDHLEKIEFQIDARSKQGKGRLGLADCYRTQEGVGVSGLSADIGKIARGIPWWMIIPMALLAGLLVWKVLSMGLHGGLRWGFHKLSVSSAENRTNAASAFNAVAPKAVSPFSALAAPGATVFVPKPTAAPPPPRTAHARGFAVLNRVLYIDTRFGLVTASSWTNTGESIIANGIEWVKDDAPAPGGSSIRR
jgi:hypothetical protein